MFVIGEAVVEEEVRKASFCCDLQACRGACCTLPGGRGAPLENDETLEIEKAYPIARQFLSDTSRRAIEAQGMFDGVPGDLATTCIDMRECVFVFFEDGIARCAFERAYEKGLTDWRKPLSCHLFPIRVRHFGRDFVRYEEIDECAPGRASGEERKVPLSNFLREPLTRKYGEKWYAQFIKRCTESSAG
jgi:hypothetical protein